MTVKALQDGEFNVSLADDVQPDTFTGSEEIEIFLLGSRLSTLECL